jgi:hypothetical protein
MTYFKWEALRRIITTLKFLTQHAGTCYSGKTHKSSNFQQLLSLRAFDVICLRTWLAQSQCSWLSYDIQNEMLQLLTDDILRKLLTEVKAAHYYALMVDETTDSNRNEQLYSVLC